MHQPLFKKVSLYQEHNEILPACHQALQDIYPGIKVRWARIYGRRWAFQYGDSFGDLPAVKYKINEQMGLIISNQELIPDQELPLVLDTLRKCLL
ncbi:MAG: hypothetical protein ACOX6L_06370 [Syntrophomonadaceae bacterium]|jgi:hypothetical protein